MAHVSLPLVWELPDVVAHVGGPVAVIGDADGSSDEKVIGVAVEPEEDAPVEPEEDAPVEPEEDAPDDSEEASDGGNVVGGFASHSGRTTAMMNNATPQKKKNPRMMTHF